VLTPDSSRFWPADQFEPGRSQPSFDKQPLRDYLDRERRAGRWDGNNPPPPLPSDVITAMSERYLEIFHRLTLAPLDSGAAN
jgi:phosphoribosylaminoimidazole-succinocarboxamide synthase